MLFNISKEDYKKTGVYCITNMINNKIYIGSTSNSFYSRYHQHLSDFKAGKREIRFLYNAFDKYGLKNFKFEIICICSKKDCLKMEQFFINKGTDYNLSMIAGSVLGLRHSINSKTRTITGGKHHCAKKIDKYSILGEYIESFNSIIEAAKSCGLKSKSNISQCIKGKVFSAGGFRWSEKGKPLPLRKKKNRGNIKVAVALKKEGFYKAFQSQTEASDFLNKQGYKCNQARIHRGINHSHEKVYGYYIIKL